MQPIQNGQSVSRVGRACLPCMASVAICLSIIACGPSRDTPPRRLYYQDAIAIVGSEPTTVVRLGNGGIVAIYERISGGWERRYAMAFNATGICTETLFEAHSHLVFNNEAMPPADAEIPFDINRIEDHIDPETKRFQSVQQRCFPFFQ